MTSIVSEIRTLGAALRTVFRHLSYDILAATCALFLFALMIYLPNLRLIMGFISNPNNPLTTKFDLLTGLLAGIQTNFTAFSATMVIAIALLFGIDLAMLTYQWRQNAGQTSQTGIATSLSGFVSGLLGIGCAACGSFLGTAIFASLGASGVVALLPLRGGEFGILGIVLLLFSIASISRVIQKHGVCLIETTVELKK